MAEREKMAGRGGGWLVRIGAWAGVAILAACVGAGVVRCVELCVGSFVLGVLCWEFCVGSFVLALFLDFGVCELLRVWHFSLALGEGEHDLRGEGGC